MLSATCFTYCLEVEGGERGADGIRIKGEETLAVDVEDFRACVRVDVRVVGVDVVAGLDVRGGGADAAIWLRAIPRKMD